MNYTQLTQEQRYQIYALKKMAHNQSEIAEYSAYTNQPSVKNFTVTVAYEATALSRLTRMRSFAGKVGSEASPNQKKRRKRSGSNDRRGKIPNRVSIDQRQEIVEQHTRLGDWEVDLIIGKGHRGVVTLTERKSRFALIRKVASKSADLVAQTVIELIKWVGHLETITADNGKEFAKHEKIAKKLDLDFYFAHPFASCEQGSNENTYDLIRQYLPKNRDLSTLTTAEELFVMDRLNFRPRKVLGFLTPYEIFFQHRLVALHC